MGFWSRLDIVKDPKDFKGFFRDLGLRDLKNGSDQNEGKTRPRADLEKNEILHLHYPQTILDRHLESFGKYICGIWEVPLG